MKKRISVACNIAGAVLLAAFVVKSIIDYTQYSAALNSAPFSVWVAVNALFLAVPAIVLFAVGLAVRKNNNKLVLEGVQFR